MSATALLERLDGVKPTGPGRWVARCPAHEDRQPSLSIRELDDGRVLLHDFAGCDVREILSAMSLTFDALFPPKPLGAHARGERRPFLPTDVFEIARREIGVAAIIACDMRQQRTISDEDMERLFIVVERLNGIAGAAYGR
jgi:hypothetical protein